MHFVYYAINEFIKAKVVLPQSLPLNLHANLVYYFPIRYYKKGKQ